MITFVQHSRGRARGSSLFVSASHFAARARTAVRHRTQRSRSMRPSGARPRRTTPTTCRCWLPRRPVVLDPVSNDSGLLFEARVVPDPFPLALGHLVERLPCQPRPSVAGASHRGCAFDRASPRGRHLPFLSRAYRTPVLSHCRLSDGATVAAVQCAAQCGLAGGERCPVPVSPFESRCGGDRVEVRPVFGGTGNRHVAWRHRLVPQPPWIVSCSMVPTADLRCRQVVFS